MTKAITIPDHLKFDGEVPAAAAAAVLDKLKAVEKELSEWQKARLGKITASCFGDLKMLRDGIMWGETAKTYLYDLIGEHITGMPSETFTGSRATEWGNLYEAEALAAYTKRTGKKTKPGQFIQHPRLPLVGGTPDAFCGEKGIIEVKCPLTFKNHIRTIVTQKVPDEYINQVYGHLILSGREWCDFVSYDPRIRTAHRIAIVRVKASEHKEEIKALEYRINAFSELLVANLKILKVKPFHNIKTQ